MSQLEALGMSVLDLLTERDIARFWRHVDRQDPAGCWPWRKTLDIYGYGAFTARLGGKPRRPKAHRVALYLSGIEIPEGVHVLHSCDSPPCCNPAHLRLGTHGENMVDRWRPGCRTNTGGYRLSFCIAQHMRCLHGCGMTVTDLARKFEVHVTTARAIVNGKSWVRPRQKGKHRLLSLSQVAEMRHRHMAGESYRSLADAYGVSFDTARCACIGKTYRAAPGPTVPQERPA